jgi:serine O-acetyltransferase
MRQTSKLAGAELIDPEEVVLSDLVDSLVAFRDGKEHLIHPSVQQRILPSRDVLIDVVESLRFVLFPGYYGSSDLTDQTVRFHVGSALDRIRRDIEEQVKRAFCFQCKEPDPSRCPECERVAFSVAQKFLSRLPEVRRVLGTDIQAAYEGDPAAKNLEEIVLSYPGFLAVTNFRLAHELHELGVPLLPRMITEHAHSITGIDIHPGALIGESFFIDHGTGVVIGETCIIGQGVRIYQGVTLGAKSFPLDEEGNPVKGIPRHPIVEDEVVIYGGATILGRITIGRGSVVGGNVWLTRSVPPASKITQGSERSGI